MFCSSCGAQVPEGTAFCGKCGRPIAGFKIGSPPAEPPAVNAGAPAGSSAGLGTTTYAGFWLRLVAAVIDGLALGIPTGFVFFLLIASALPVVMMRPPNPMAIVIAILPRVMMFVAILLAGSWLYWALMESSTWQATLGKKALGLYVTDLEGNRLTFGRASGRFFAGRGIAMVPYVGGLYYLVSCILAGFTEKKQALHDIIANCLVKRKV